MAVVYLARDVRHARPVAIKVLHPELAHAIGSERFLREIGIAASLSHPHILPLLDSGVFHRPEHPDATHLWYAMPYVDGESLRQRLARDKQLPLAEALRIGGDVASALAYAHSRGIVHRDIKPENILVAGGEAIVADFGVARAVSAAAADTLTPSGLALGTPVYMSPEQATGDRAVDGRSDVYSLGCVLYEMLAGEPPFTGATAQAILAKRLAGEVPPLHLVRDGIPREVETAIERALSRTPADRFSSAEALAEALGRTNGADTRPVGRPARRSWLAPAAAVVLALVLLGAVLAGWRAKATPGLDADLVAVAPFDALAPGLAPWSQGMVDVLARSLDGAGPLRTVPPSVALRGWRGRSDRASAAALGRRTGAGLVLFGALERRGQDSVLARAALLDVASGVAPPDIEVWGDTARLYELADSLAVALLRDLGRTRPVGAVRHAPLGAASLPALKAFLQGEQHYRENLWDSALSHYAHAVALDSTFALAYRRLGLVLEWHSPTAATFRGYDEYLRRAAALNHGLAPRDSLLILADTLTLALTEDLRDGPGRDHFTNRRRLLATLAEARRRYPGDPEVWHRVGETWMHLDDRSVATHREVLDAFDQAIALDSTFAPAYVHASQLALLVELGDPERARRYLDAYLRHTRTEDPLLRLPADLLDPERAGLPETRSRIEAATAGVIWNVALGLIHWPDSAETAVALLRRLVAGRHDAAGVTWLADPRFQRRSLAFTLMARGRLREAYRSYAEFSGPRTDPFGNLYARLALLGAVPPDTAAAVFRRALAGDSDANRAGLVEALPWWFTQGDTLALARFAAGAAAAADRDRAHPVLSAMSRYAAEAAQAFVLLSRGDSAGALQALAALPDSICSLRLLHCHPQKLAEASLLEAAGDDEGAVKLLDRWSELRPRALLQRARIAERLGDPERARANYLYVSAIWRNADPSLREYVQEARAGLARLPGGAVTKEVR